MMFGNLLRGACFSVLLSTLDAIECDDVVGDGKRQCKIRRTQSWGGTSERPSQECCQSLVSILAFSCAPSIEDMAEFKAFMHIAGTGHCSSTFPQQHRLVCSKLENIFSDSCDESTVNQLLGKCCELSRVVSNECPESSLAKDWQTSSCSGSDAQESASPLSRTLDCLDNPSSSCWFSRVTEISKSGNDAFEGLQAALVFVHKSLCAGVIADCHMFVHLAGELAYARKRLESPDMEPAELAFELVTKCATNDCIEGCTHAVIASYISEPISSELDDQQIQQRITKFQDLCTSYGCTHGIGHGLLSGILSSEGLQTAERRCHFARNAQHCIGGLGMEYAMVTLQSVESAERMLPKVCSDFSAAGIDGQTCANNVGEGLMFLSNNDLSVAGVYCEKLGNKDLTEVCHSSAANMQSFNAEDKQKRCKSLTGNHEMFNQVYGTASLNEALPTCSICNQYTANMKDDWLQRLEVLFAQLPEEDLLALTKIERCSKPTCLTGAADAFIPTPQAPGTGQTLRPSAATSGPGRPQTTDNSSASSTDLLEVPVSASVSDFKQASNEERGSSLQLVVTITLVIAAVVFCAVCCFWKGLKKVQHQAPGEKKQGGFIKLQTYPDGHDQQVKQADSLSLVSLALGSEENHNVLIDAESASDSGELESESEEESEPDEGTAANSQQH